MTGKHNYQALYQLQDRVLDVVFVQPVSFYLTGGTCLHRYYTDNERYSDALDLFTSDVSLFRDEVRAVLARFTEAGMSVQTSADTRDFVRIVVDNRLQVDFVCDRVVRVGAPVVRDDGLRIDTVANIFANKICAVMGRDDPKDVFDLCVMLRQGSVDVAAGLQNAAGKCAFDREELDYRLRSFPVALFDALPVSDPRHVAEIKSTYLALLRDHLISGS